MMVAADHPNLFICDLVCVADRAITDEAASERLLVQLLVDRRAAVGDPGCEQNGASFPAAGTRGRRGSVRGLVTLELGDELALDFRAKFARLVAHSLEQLGPLDPIGK